MAKIKVFLPIEVPVGDMCWDGETVCEHFDNEGGHATCDLGMYPMEMDTGKVMKPIECLIWALLKIFGIC